MPRTASKSRGGAFICFSCRNIFAVWRAVCPECGYVDAMGFDPKAVVSEEIEEPEEDAPVAAGNVVATEKLRISTGIQGLDDVLGGGLTKEISAGAIRGSSILLSGPRGGSKSRLSLFALSRPAKARLKCLYVSSEERAERLAMYVKEGRLSPKIHLYSTTDFDRAIGLAGDGFKGCPGPLDIVVFDSAQKFKLKGRLREVSEGVRNFTSTHPTIVILLSQENRAGDPSGTNELASDLDVVLRVSRQGAEIRLLECVAKNRFGRDDGRWLFKIDENSRGLHFTTLKDAPPEEERMPAPQAPFEKPPLASVTPPWSHTKPSAMASTKPSIPAAPPAPKPPMPRPPPLPQKPPRRPLSKHPGLHIVPSRKD